MHFMTLLEPAKNWLINHAVDVTAGVNPKASLYFNDIMSFSKEIFNEESSLKYLSAETTLNNKLKIPYYKYWDNDRIVANIFRINTFILPLNILNLHSFF